MRWFKKCLPIGGSFFVQAEPRPLTPAAEITIRTTTRHHFNFELSIYGTTALDCTLSLLTMEESNPELESFRQQWKAEVIAKAKAEGNNKEPQSSIAESSKTTRRPPAAPRIPTEKGSKDEDIIEPQIHHDLERSSGVDGPGDGESSTSKGKQPQSALEHYERAVERESAGVLGDSLDLYRKAFKVSVVPSAWPYS